MYDELYTPLPNLSLALSGIGINAAENPSLEFLDKLVYAFQTHIPFEDINSAYLKVPVSLGIDDLYNKIVTQKRGGYCFELNCFFYTMLCELGFKAFPCQCRVVRGADLSSAHIPLLHRGTLVELDDKLLYVDVGFGGPSPSGWIEVLDGSIREIRGETFLIEKNGKWWTLFYLSSSGEFEHIIQLLTNPCENVDFLPGNEFCSKNERAIFANTLVVNLRTENGSISLTDRTLTIRQNHEIIKSIQVADNELPYVFEKYFGIVI